MVELQKDLDGLTKRLSAPSFVNNDWQAVVAQNQDFILITKHKTFKFEKTTSHQNFSVYFHHLSGSQSNSDLNNILFSVLFRCLEVE